MQLEKIKCPVCNSSDHRLVFNAKDLRLKTCKDIFCVVSCANCGFLFLNPRPVKEEAINFYPPDFNREGPTLMRRALGACLMPIENSMIRMLKKHKKSGKLLDIGCGSGRFMQVMGKHGFDVWGCELNADSKAFAPKTLDGRILYGDLVECSFPAKSFDLITMFQSLEHMNNLEEVLKEVKRILKDDGIVYIYVPNMKFFEFRLFGPYYYNLEVPRHLYFFTRDSINKLLRTHGFKVGHFFRNHILELVSTPTSLHYGLWAWLEDKNILKNKLLKGLTFFPLIALRLILRIFSMFDEQNLKITCYKA